MRFLTAKNITEAWFEAVKLIINEGKEVEHENKLLKEIDNLILEIENPLEIGKLDINYKDYINELKFQYEIYPSYSLYTPEYERISNYFGINQLEMIIEKLKKKPESRSATMSFLAPNIDLKDIMPCGCIIDYKIKGNQLNTTAVYRSHDYGKKALPNLAFLSELIEKVCNESKIKPGKLICHSISAHIYYFSLY